MELPERTHTAERDVEWWTIERRPARGGRTRYGIRIGTESVAAGHGSLFDAIDAALAVLAGRETAEAGN